MTTLQVLMPMGGLGQRFRDVGVFTPKPLIEVGGIPMFKRALRSLAARAGFAPRVVHRIDSLELVDDLILAGRGVALLPRGSTSRRGVSVLRLGGGGVHLRAYAVTRRGRDGWPPLRAVVQRLAS